MALERVPADIRADGGVARMSNPRMIEEIKEAVTIPVMAKARIGHFAEAQVLQALEVDYIDESEVLTPADEANHIDKFAFDVPFVCGATDLGEALRRIGEGAAMIRSKGEAGTGNIVEAVRHMRGIVGGIRRLARSARGAGRRGQGAARAARGRPRGRRARVAAGAAVLRRRHRDARRRRADDAARRRGQLRRLRDLQVRGPRAAARGRSSRRRRTSTIPSASPPPRRISASRCAGDDIAQLAADGRAAPATRLVSAPAEPAARRRPRLQGDFAAHVRMLRWLGADARSRCARPSELAGLDGLVIPGGESTTITKAIERDGLEPAIRAHAEGGGRSSAPAPG